VALVKMLSLWILGKACQDLINVQCLRKVILKVFTRWARPWDPPAVKAILNLLW
jgi:hypothetical protein